MTLDDLSDRADVIVLGTCIEVHGQLTPDGVVTHQTLNVERVVKGQVGRSFEFTTYGGVTPERGTFVPGAPTFTSGEVVLVFLERENAKGLRMAIGMAQGKYTIREVDGRRLAYRNLEGLRLVDATTGAEEEAGTDQGVPLDDLLTAITTRLGKEPR